MQRTATFTAGGKKGATLHELRAFVEALPHLDMDDPLVRVKVRATMGGGLRSMTVTWVDEAES